MRHIRELVDRTFPARDTVVQRSVTQTGEDADVRRHMVAFGEAL